MKSGFVSTVVLCSAFLLAAPGIAETEPAKPRGFPEVRAAFGYGELDRLIEEFGEPDLSEVSTNSPIAMRFVTYDNAKVKVFAYAQREEPTWKIGGFMDSELDKGISPAEAKNRLKKRLSGEN